MTQFKVGDRVRALACTRAERLVPPGSIGTVVDITSDPCGDDPLVQFDVDQEVLDGGQGGLSRAWYCSCESIEIEYDPPRTRNGFMPGDRVRHISGERGVVLYSRHAASAREWIGGDFGSVEVDAKNLTLLSDDTGDPPRTRGPLGGIALQSHATALQKGFYDDLEYARRRVDDPKVLAFIERLWLMARCALIHSEVSEMVEAIRDDALTATSKDGKPEGLPSEMADVVIRLADLAGGLGIDLDRAVAEKMSYNATRKHMYGRKA